MSNQMNLLGEEQGTPLFSQPTDRKPATVNEFVKKFYSDEAQEAYGLEPLTQWATEDLQRHGYTFVARHDSVTGIEIAYPFMHERANTQSFDEFITEVKCLARTA